MRIETNIPPFPPNLRCPNGPFEREIWKRINRPEVIEQMKAAAKLKRASVEVLDEYFSDLRPRIAEDKTKQVTGLLVSKVMERIDHEALDARARTPQSTIYRSGKVYRKRQLDANTKNQEV